MSCQPAMIYAADAEVEFSDDESNYDKENSETEEESSDNSVDLIEEEDSSYESGGEDTDNATVEEESHDGITDTDNDDEQEFSDGEDIWSDGSNQVLFASEAQSVAPEYDVWLSNTIVSGLSMDGTAYGDPMYTLFKQMQEPIYAELGGLLLEDVPLMSISSVWNNVVKREFYTNQKLIYETLLVEYIKHENKTNASLFDTTQVDRANSYLIKMFNELADGGVQDWSPDKFMEMTVEEAVQSFQNVQGVKTAIERAQSVSENVQELFKLTSSILAMNDVKEEKVQLIKSARNACASMENPNKDFINACDEIIEAIESTDIDINYIKTQVASVIRQKAIDKVWGNLCDKNPILKSIDWTADAMDILFNTSDAATNNLKLSILYTMDCYFKMGLSNAATQYLNHKTDNTAAQTFDSCFEGYVNFQIYGNDTAKSWISSVHDDGALNHAFTYIFCREALKNASELKDLCDSQNKTRNQMLNIIGKYQDIYSNLYMKDEYKEAMSAPITPTPIVDPKDYKISEGITSPNPEMNSGGCGEAAYWKLFKDGTLIIYGTGWINLHQNYWGATWYNNSIKKVQIAEGITGIGYEAFYKCEQLKSVIIPNTVTRIDVKAFYACSNLSIVELGSGLERIDSEAFAYCIQLKSITIPSNLKECDGAIFRSCTNLKTVGPESGNYNIKLESTETIIAKLFSFSEIEEVHIPDTVREIGYYEFSNCNNLTTVILGNRLEKISLGAFYECGQLKNITIPNTVKEIGNSTFYRCKQLKNITIPDAVKEIEDNVFQECSSLTVVRLGSKLEKIGDYAFMDCKQLESIIILNTVKEIGYYAFKNCSNNFIIYGYLNSYAQTYADGYGISFVDLKDSKPTATPVIPTGKFTVKLSSATLAYNGKTQTPSITVTYKGKKLSNKYYTAKYTNNKNIGTATVTVTGKGTYKKCSGKATFKIVLRTGAISSLKAGKKYIMLNWKTITGSTGYQIQYSTSKNFAKAKTLKIAGAKKHSTTIKKLTSKKTYYVRVRAYRTANRKTVYGAWSGSKKVVVK